MAFAIQSEVSVVINPIEMEGFRSSPLFGIYSPEMALNSILKGTPFGFSYSADRNSVLFYRRLDFNPRVPVLSGFLDKINSEEEVIVTALGLGKSLRRAPAIASVITAEEIKLMGALDLDEVLENVPGLHVSLSGLNRLDSVYSIRGIHSGFNPHVLLLINSVPVQYSLAGGRPARFKLPVSSVEKIEVIRGPGSAIYGADAYSGVINVITKGFAREAYVEVGGGRGSFDSSNRWMHSEYKKNNWNFLFDAAHERSDGDRSRLVSSDFQTQLDTFFGTDASLAPTYLSTRYEITDVRLAISRNNWRLNYWLWESLDAGLGAGGAQALDINGYDDSRVDLLDYTYTARGDEWDHSLKLSQYDYELKAHFNLLPPGAIIPIGEDGNANFMEPVGMVEFSDGLIGHPGAKMKDALVEATVVYHGNQNHRTRIATGYRQQRLDVNEKKNFGPGVIDGSESVVDGQLTDVTETEYVFADNSRRNVFYLSVQDEWQLSRAWELTAGLRYDEYSDFGKTINPRVALVWSENESLTAKFLYGSAFRAPSFGEQSYKNNPISVGSDNLDPEVIDTYEVAASLRLTKNLKTNLNLFFYLAQDMIDFIPDESIATSNTAQNTRDQEGHGFEWELHWSPSREARVKSTISWNQAMDKATGANIADAPTRQVFVGASWEFVQNMFMHVDMHWVGGRHRSVGDGRSRIDDYGVINLSLRKKNLFNRVNVSLSVKNLMNEDAYEPSTESIEGDYPLEGRSFWVELTYKIGQ